MRPPAGRCKWAAMSDGPREQPSPDQPDAIDPTFLDVVGKIADGNPVDWDTSLATTPARDEAIRQLKRLESVLAGHREASGDRPPGAPSSDAPVLFHWGRLEVREKIGEGTFGEVYRAWDPGVGREVALKLRKSGASSKDTRRWLDEARRLARVRHPNVLHVYGADEHEGRAGIWTELLFGHTLEERMKREGPMGAREAALIGTDLCSALAAVHAAGLIHGDIKATNIMREGAALADTPPRDRVKPGGRGDAGRIVLMDFGTATDRHALEANPGARLYATPLTAAPEVLEGRDESAASDIYSLGVVLYRQVTEQYPIEASTLEELRAAAKNGAQTSLRTIRPDLPASFVQVIERATATRPADRFASAADMERALAATLGSSSMPQPPVSSRPRMRISILALLGAVAVLTVAAFAWRTFGPREADVSKRMTIPAVSKSPVEARLVHTISGTEAEGSVGLVLDIADLDHDGFADYFVGAPHASGGHMYVYLGGPGSDDTPDLELSRGESSDQFGRFVCASGDVNGDGIADVLVGETQGGTGPGRVHVFLGGRPFDNHEDLVLTGEGTRDHFGVRICTLDFNADGFDDIVVGAYFNDDWAGRAYLYFGGKTLHTTPDLIFSGANRGDGLGNAMSTGDLNHDGYADLALAAYWNNTAAVHAGRVYVYYGGPSPDAVSDFTFDGAAAGDEFGCSICSSGDFDGDGSDDLAVGAHLNAVGGYEVGSAYVFRGGSQMDRIADWTFVGESPGDEFGTDVLLCDVSGDKIADLIVSAPMNDAGGRDVGRAYVFLGGHRPDTKPAIVLTGRATEDHFGGAFVASHDAGGEVAELLIGAHLNDFGATNAGQAYVYRFVRR
jgi:serine/threonine protein kinase